MSGSCKSLHHAFSEESKTALAASNFAWEGAKDEELHPPHPHTTQRSKR